MKTMAKRTLLVLCAAFTVLSVNSENCDRLGTLLYDDLGCKPVNKEGQECPIKYECGAFEKNDSCVFRGRSYNIHEHLDNDLTYDACNVGCFCIRPSQFTCAVLDCPEWLRALPEKPSCYRKYEPGKCCSVGVNCPLEDSTLGTCEVNGLKLREGERFNPEGTCMGCVCPKHYKGINEAPFCKRKTCGVQIRHSEELVRNCAPCYLKPNDDSICCPNDWVCPSPTDTITKVNPSADSNSELTCRFGTKEVKLGEGLQKEVEHYGSKRNVKCECVLPPLLTCKEV